MKTLILASCILFTQTTFIFSQTAIKYFKLDENYKYAEYTRSDSLKITFQYNIDNDSILIITNKAEKSNFEYSQIQEIYKISNNRIILSGIKRDFFNERREDTTFLEEKIVFILPDNENKMEWSYTDAFGDSYFCTSEFVQILYNNKNVLAVKVFRKNKKDKSDKDIYFYIENIGLYKIEVENDANKFIVFQELSNLIVK